MKISNNRNFSTPLKSNNTQSFKASLLAQIPVQNVPVPQKQNENTPLPYNAAYVPVSTPVANSYKGSLLTILTNNVNASSQPAIPNQPIAPITPAIDDTPLIGYKNNLRSMFQNNQAVIYALIPRTFNAKDTDGNNLIEGNEEPGYFTNMVERLDELKVYGINTLHLLPINPTGLYAAKGNAGSVYAPKDYLSIDPCLDDPRNPKNVHEEARDTIKECHKRNIKVMLDLPSCMSVDLYDARPDLRAEGPDKNPKTPEGWEDIRMFNPWEDEDKEVLNKALLDYHKKFIDMCIDLGIDGIRADVGRAKPPQFWDELICYARSKDPEFAFLAECYTYEDASPMKNMPADRPEDVLDAGFDSFYGQYHNFYMWKARDFHDFVKESIDITNRQDFNGNRVYDKGKSLIGSFATHDDKSPMSHGGADYCMMTNVIQTTLPMTNPYIISGYESGDRYIYSYSDKYVNTTFAELLQNPSYTETIDGLKKMSDKAKQSKNQKDFEDIILASDECQKLLNSNDKYLKVENLAKLPQYQHAIKHFSTNPLTKDNIKYCTHNEKLDIFNKSRKPGGENPEIGFHFGYLMNCVRPKYGELITKGSYIELPVKGNKRDEIIAYARYKDGKAIITIANHDVNAKEKVKVLIPGLRNNQQLNDLAPKYGTGSEWKSENGALEITLGPAQAHIFELDNFDISKVPSSEVYKQHL